MTPQVAGCSHLHARFSHRWRFTAIALLLVMLSTTGCALRQIRQDVAEGRRLGLIAGTVIAEGSTENVRVVLYERRDDAGTPSTIRIAGTTQLTQLQDLWVFTVEPQSRYYVMAFEDLDRDQHRDPDEPTALLGDGQGIRPSAGVKLGYELELTQDVVVPAMLPTEIASAASESQAALRFSVGEMASLDDERFSPDVASAGLWQPLGTLRDVGAGLYFLEPYDPGRTPVLFVHGIGGTPRDFMTLIENLDRTRFQPWIFHYPSGIRLGDIGQALKIHLASLQEKLDYRSLIVIAHSMGGLVARSSLLQLQDDPDAPEIPGLFITLATPLEGHSAAKWGLKFTPEPVPSWIDIEPGSSFLTDLQRPLSDRWPYFLLFAFRRSGNILMAASHDSVVQVRSQLPLWAQQQALRVRGFDLDHMGILTDDEAVAMVQSILATRDTQATARRGAP